MRFLLIHPRSPVSVWDYIKLPPLGLAYVAGALRAANYPDVRILDANVSPDPAADVARAVQEYAPDVVGLTATSLVAGVVLDLARSIKSSRRQIVTVIGGVHPTALPEEVARHEAVDYVVFGEGENTMVELAKSIEQGRTPDGVLGVCFRRNGTVTLNPWRPAPENLDDLPFPAYDLLPIRRYAYLQGPRIPAVSMITSRGCPYRCLFCSAHAVFGRRYRAHSPERTVEEMTLLVRRFQVREIAFKDSEFTFDAARVERICDLILEKCLKIAWSCNGRAGSVTVPLLKRMRRAGCRLVAYGVESGDQRILDRLKKDITVEEVIETFDMSREAGLKTAANFIIGSPGEDWGSIEKTIALAKRLRPDFAGFYPLMLLPGSGLYDLAAKNNGLPEGPGPPAASGGDHATNATSLTAEEVSQALRKAMRAFYLRPTYLLKRLLTLRPYEWKMNLKGLLFVIQQ